MSLLCMLRSLSASSHLARLLNHHSRYVIRYRVPRNIFSYVISWWCSLVFIIYRIICCCSNACEDLAERRMMNRRFHMAYDDFISSVQNDEYQSPVPYHSSANSAHKMITLLYYFILLWRCVLQWSQTTTSVDMVNVNSNLAFYLIEIFILILIPLSPQTTTASIHENTENLIGKFPFIECV
jgi:hypothetical protein